MPVGRHDGAVAELLVHDGSTRPGVVCPRAGWLGETGSACPVCGTGTRAVPDVVDDLGDGGAIEHVAAGTELEARLVVARLHHRLPARHRGRV
jgi:hypothetical protein